MARLFTSGFETNSNTIEWTASAGTPVIQIATIRGGKYAGECTSTMLTAGTPVGWAYQFSVPTFNGPCYFRFYFNVHTRPGSANIIATANSGTTVSKGGNYEYINLNTDGTLELFDNLDISIGKSAALTNDTWYQVEFSYDNTNTTITARLNGTQFASSITANTAGLKSLVIGGNIENSINTSGDWFFDDIAINDSTGATNNSFPGESPAVLAKQNYKTLRPRAFAPGIAR